MSETNSATKALPTKAPRGITLRDVKAVNITSLQIRHDAKESNHPSEQGIGACGLQPKADRVLIQRIEEESAVLLTDKPKSIKGIVLAVGPGKWIPGEYWWLKDGELIDGVQPYGWNWIPGHRQELMLKPGMKVLFNSKWNDFSAGENKGTGADGSGPLERPLPLKADPMLHLVQEADVFAIVPHFNFKASIKPTYLETTYFRNVTTAEVG